jgi:hypothetical protein
MEDLGAALAWAAACPELPSLERSTWAFYSGSWLAGRGDANAALAALGASDDGRAHALAARLLLRVKRDAAAAAACYRRISDTAILWHPQVVCERDVTLAKVFASAQRAGDAAAAAAALSERRTSLEAVGALVAGDDWLFERSVALLGDEGRPQEALGLLEGRTFQLVHQRYARTLLWRRLRAALGYTSDAGTPPPESLGEDQLAVFGAYSEDSGAEA